MPNDDAIAGLREAVRVSPNNLPLRQALADALMGMGRYDEAEAEYKAALGLSPDSDKLKVALATAFYQQGKNSPALVIVEDLLKANEPAPRALVLHAKLMVRTGDVERAVRQYKRAVEADPAVADLAFAQQLGIGAGATDEASDGRLRAAREDDGEPPPGQIERPKITFADVGGMDALKDDIRMKVIHPLQHAELYAAYGKTVGGGILMYGPPGCGKTHLARATAGEIDAAFISIGINDVLDMWIGRSERNLHALFDQARRSRPCVLFFDEVDALAASRQDMRASAGRHLINQFLAEMDGMGRQQRRRADPGRHQRPLARGCRLPPARPVRPHPVRPPARRPRPRRHPPHPAQGQAGRRHRPRRRGQEVRRLQRRRPQGRGRRRH